MSLPPNSPILLLADLHLKPESPWDTQAFLELMERSRHTVGALYLLGDLFEFWIGEPRLETPFQQSILRALQRLRQAGVRIGYVEGNRDYRVAQGRAELFDFCSQEALELQAAGRRVLLIHGDRINPLDRAYRAWRGFSRHPLVLGCFRRLPAALANRAAAAIERRLRRSNAPHKRAFPQQIVQQYGAARLREGFDAIVLGHFHREQVLATEHGSLYLLGAWGPRYRYLELGKDGLFCYKNAQ